MNIHTYYIPYYYYYNHIYNEWLQSDKFYTHWNEMFHTNLTIFYKVYGNDILCVIWYANLYKMFSIHILPSLLRQFCISPISLLFFFCFYFSEVFYIYHLLRSMCLWMPSFFFSILFFRVGFGLESNWLFLFGFRARINILCYPEDLCFFYLLCIVVFKLYSKRWFVTDITVQLLQLKVWNINLSRIANLFSSFYIVFCSTVPCYTVQQHGLSREHGQLDSNESVQIWIAFRYSSSE